MRFQGRTQRPADSLIHPDGVSQIEFSESDGEMKGRSARWCGLASKRCADRERALAEKGVRVGRSMGKAAARSSGPRLDGRVPTGTGVAVHDFEPARAQPLDDAEQRAATHRTASRRVASIGFLRRCVCG